MIRPRRAQPDKQMPPKESPQVAAKRLELEEAASKVKDMRRSPVYEMAKEMGFSTVLFQTLQSDKLKLINAMLKHYDGQQQAEQQLDLIASTCTPWSWETACAFASKLRAYDEGGRLSAAQREHWHACFCYGAIVRVIHPDSYATFCEDFFDVLLLLGSRVLIMPSIATIFGAMQPVRTAMLACRLYLSPCRVLTRSTLLAAAPS